MVRIGSYLGGLVGGRIVIRIVDEDNLCEKGCYGQLQD